MKTENWKLKIVFFFLLFTPLQAVLALELQVPIGTKTSVSNLAEYIKAIYEFGVAGAGILAAIMIMVGGFLWLTAAGNATQVGNAKSYISSAILGLVLALTSYMILNLINPKLVSLEMPVITPVERMASEGCNWQATCEAGTYSEDTTKCSSPAPENQKCCCKVGVGSPCGDNNDSVCLKGMVCNTMKTVYNTNTKKWEGSCREPGTEGTPCDKIKDGNKDCGESAPFCVIDEDGNGPACRTGLDGSPCIKDDDCDQSKNYSCDSNILRLDVCKKS